MPRGETSFFESPDYERSSLSELQALFIGRNEKRLGIKRPSYLTRSEVPSRIACDLPEAKLIAVLRNPIDRAISAYYHYINFGFLPAINIEVGMHHILSDRGFLRTYPRATEVLQFGMYGSGLSQYLNYFDRQRMAVLLHEDLLSAPHEYIRTVFEFLEVDATFIPPSIDHCLLPGVYSIRRLKFLRLRNPLLYNYNSSGTRLFVRNAGTFRRLAAVMLSAFDRTVMAPIFGNNKPILSQELKSKIYAYYQEDMILLERILGKKLDAWRPKA